MKLFEGYCARRGNSGKRSDVSAGYRHASPAETAKWRCAVWRECHAGFRKISSGRSVRSVIFLKHTLDAGRELLRDPFVDARGIQVRKIDGLFIRACDSVDGVNGAGHAAGAAELPRTLPVRSIL